MKARLSGLMAKARPWFVGAVGLLFILASGCEKYRVEYRKRPAFYEKAAVGELPSQVTLDDGTVINYSSQYDTSSFGRSGEARGKPFQIREESQTPDGKTIVTLRAAVPEHVLRNALACVQKEEYELMWEQLLADYTRKEYEKQEQGFDEFAAFFSKHRHDLAATLTRMVAGIPTQEVSFTPRGNNVTRCKLRPQVAEPFKFKIVDVIKEDQQWKLLMIY